MHITRQSTLQILYVWRHGLVVASGDQLARLLMQDNKLFLEVRTHQGHRRASHVDEDGSKPTPAKRNDSLIFSPEGVQHRDRRRRELASRKGTEHREMGLLRVVVEIVETLLSSWYCKVKFQVYIPSISHTQLTTHTSCTCCMRNDRRLFLVRATAWFYIRIKNRTRSRCISVEWACLKAEAWFAARSTRRSCDCRRWHPI